MLIRVGATAELRPRDHLLIWVMAGPSVIVSPRVGGGGPLGAAGGHWGPPGFRGAHLPLRGAAPLARPAPRNCVGHSSLCCITLPVTPPWLTPWGGGLASECLAGLFGGLLPGGLASGWPAAGHRLASGCLAGLFGGLLPGNVGHQFRGNSCSERALAFITGGTTLRGWGRWRRRWRGRWRRRRRRGRRWRAGHPPRSCLFSPSSPFVLLDLPLQLMFIIRIVFREMW